MATLAEYIDATRPRLEDYQTADEYDAAMATWTAEMNGPAMFQPDQTFAGPGGETWTSAGSSNQATQGEYQANLLNNRLVSAQVQNLQGNNDHPNNKGLLQALTSRAQVRPEEMQMALQAVRPDGSSMLHPYISSILNGLGYGMDIPEGDVPMTVGDAPLPDLPPPPTETVTGATDDWGRDKPPPQYPGMDPTPVDLPNDYPAPVYPVSGPVPGHDDYPARWLPTNPVEEPYYQPPADGPTNTEGPPNIWPFDTPVGEIPLGYYEDGTLRPPVAPPTYDQTQPGPQNIDLSLYPPMIAQWYLNKRRTNNWPPIQPMNAIGYSNG